MIYVANNKYIFIFKMVSKLTRLGSKRVAGLTHPLNGADTNHGITDHKDDIWSIITLLSCNLVGYLSIKNWIRKLCFSEL